MLFIISQEILCLETRTAKSKITKIPKSKENSKIPISKIKIKSLLHIKRMENSYHIRDLVTAFLSVEDVMDKTCFPN